MPLFRVVLRPRALVAPIALLLPLVAAAPASAGSSLPTISKVSPLKIEIGGKLTIKGRNFIPGKQANIVVFKRSGKPAIFVKADSATRTRITVTVPEKVGPFLVDSTGAVGTYVFRLRVLARRLGKAFTATKASPAISAKGSGQGAIVAQDCDLDKIPNASDPDDDNDGLTDAQEATYKTDPCKADSDGDGVSDNFEVESARDLNVKALPFPGKKPYPNALDGSDANVDFDQDGLTLKEEYELWIFTGSKTPLTYSDGEQDSAGPTVVTSANADLDMDGNGVLTDDEKDADNDGLGNWDEQHGRMTAGWWAAVFQNEKPYVGAPGASPLLDPSFVDQDSDGDGVLDGADDQDHDGMANLDEIDRFRVVDAGGMLWVNPFNPCLPDFNSRVCSLHPPIADPWAPFPLTSPPPASPLHWSAAPATP